MMRSLWWHIRRNIKHFACYYLCRFQYVGDKYLFAFCSYCHRCGGTQHDFWVSDALWVEATIQAKRDGIIDKHQDWNAGVFCFNCFIELLEERGFLYFPLLTPMHEDGNRLITIKSKLTNTND